MTGINACVEQLAFLSRSRFFTVDVSSGNEDLSLPVEFSVTYLSQLLIISGNVFSTSLLHTS